MPSAAAPASYLRRVYAVPAELEEAWSALLWAGGDCVGVETRETPAGVFLEAYVLVPEAGSQPPALLPGVELLREEAVADADWLAPWRRQAQPLAIGRRLVIDPRDQDPAEESTPAAAEGTAGRRVLYLPARRAFGTGSHESTRLALELLEEMAVEDRLGLDVGTGSGILAFAALVFGARQVVATEIDLEALLVAGENRRRNGLWPAFTAARLATLAPTGRFDFALVNILPERILPELDLLPPLLRPEAEVVFSGILTERREEMRGEFARRRLEVVQERQAAEWVAFRCRYRP